MDEEEILLKEHDVLIRLYMHEDKVFWNLSSLFVAVNVGLATVFAMIVSWPHSAYGLFENAFSTMTLVATVGLLANLIGVALFSKNNFHRQKWLSKALNIENEMKRNGRTIEILEGFEQKIVDSEENRFLKWFKCRGNLNRAHLWPLAIAIIWLIAIIFSILRWSGILG